jgi:Tol biopolymer transport system component
VFEVHADGSGGHALLAGDYPAFARDGRVAFTQNGVWTATENGARRRRIVPPFADYLTYTSPAWADDGTELAYIRVDNGHETNELWLVRPDGRALHGLSIVHQASSPTWAPDGSWIAYAGDGGLSEVTPDGSRRRLLVRGTVDSPAWSPDGRHIAYELDQGTRVLVRILDLKTHIGRTVEPNLRSAGPLVWSPDGRWLAFTTQRDIAGGAVVQLRVLDTADERSRIVTQVFVQHLDGLTWRQ